MSVVYKKSPRDELVTSIILPEEPELSQEMQQEEKLQKMERIQSPKKQKQMVAQKSNFNNEPLLYGQLNNADRLTSYAEKQMIQHFQNLIETKVHDIEAAENQKTTLNNIYKNSVGQNQFLEHGIQDVVNRVAQKASGSLNQRAKQKKKIPLTKDDLRQLQKVDKYRLLKIKNGEIKNKVGDLRSLLQNQYFQRKANFQLPAYENIKQSDYYSIDNPRTKEANDFIQKIQKQRTEQKQRYFQYIEKKRQEENMKRSMEIERKQTLAEQRKQRLEEIYRQKQLKRKLQQQENYKKRQDFKQWSKIYNKQRPLYIKKQEEFIQRQLIPQIYNRRQKLLQIKMQRRPIDVGQINEHDQRYMDYKKDDAIRNEAQRQIEKQKMKQFQQEQRQLYKGKYRYMALEEMMNQKLRNSENIRDFQRQKKVRQLVYGEQIKQKALQQFKIKQLQTLNLEKKEFSKRKRNADGTTSVVGNEDSKMTSYTDPKADGKRNLHFLHELVKEKGVKKDRPYIKLVEQKNVYPDYLHELHEKRRSVDQSNLRSSIHEQSYDSNKNNKLDSLMAIEKRMQQKLERDSLRKKYSSVDYKQDVNIQQNELGAVRLKMKLINQLD